MFQCCATICTTTTMSDEVAKMLLPSSLRNNLQVTCHPKPQSRQQMQQEQSYNDNMNSINDDDRHLLASSSATAGD